MNVNLDQLFSIGYVRIEQDSSNLKYLVDATSSKATEQFRSFNPNIKLIAEHEGVLERFFEYVPETYFQLLDVSEKSVEVRLQNSTGLAPILKERKFIHCVLNSDKSLSSILQRFRKPLALIEFDRNHVNSKEYQVLLQAEKQTIQYSEPESQKATLIQFETSGAFKILRK